MSLSSAFSDSDLLRQIANRSLDVFFLYNLKTHRFEYVNEVFEEIFGSKEQHLYNELPRLLERIDAEDVTYLKTRFERLLTNSFRQQAEFRLRMSDHSQKWINITAYVILQGEQRHSIAGFASDVSHHKENELAANKFSAHKNAILEMMAHDLGGPLGMMKYLAEEITHQGRDNGVPIVEEYATIIQQTAQKSIELIHQLLETEYLESSETALKLQRIELIEQLQSLMDGFQKMDINHKKRFSLQSSSPQITIQVDQTKFLQAISNLLSNAVKFTRDDGHISLTVEERAQSILLSVSDDGIGIPVALQAGLFERFTKARRPGLRGEATVGLGLSIVKWMVELHKGKIWCESEENAGCTFYIQLPQQSDSGE